MPEGVEREEGVGAEVLGEAFGGNDWTAGREVSWVNYGGKARREGRDVLGRGKIAQRPCCYQSAAIPEDFGDVALVEGGGLLAAGDFVEFRVAPCSWGWLHSGGWGWGLRCWSAGRGGKFVNESHWKVESLGELECVRLEGGNRGFLRWKAVGSGIVGLLVNHTYL